MKYVSLSDENGTVFVYGGIKSDCLYRIENPNPNLKTLRIPAGTKTLGRECLAYSKVQNIIIPDGVETIREKAFCRSFARNVFISKSVKNVEDCVFWLCGRITNIYCEGEPEKGWLMGEKVVTETYRDMTDAFNFHRSGGSFDDCYIVKDVETKYNHFNPENCPIHTHVSLEEFEKIIAEYVDP